MNFIDNLCRSTPEFVLVMVRAIEIPEVKNVQEKHVNLVGTLLNMLTHGVIGYHGQLRHFFRNAAPENKRSCRKYKAKQNINYHLRVSYEKPFLPVEELLTGGIGLPLRTGYISRRTKRPILMFSPNFPIISLSASPAVLF